MSPTPSPWPTALTLAVSAALAEQVLHEVTHGLVAVAVGKRWDALHLFASVSSWPDAPWDLGDGLVAGSAALVNIAVGIGCAVALSRSRWNDTRPSSGCGRSTSGRSPCSPGSAT